ncbi:MAG: hypothetical protein AB9903_34225 [Vulcanimicrobiota bacterium]
MTSKKKTPGPLYKRAIQAFEFFHKYAQSGNEFGLQELALETGWMEQTVKTYISKKFEAYLEKSDEGRYRVNRDFVKVTQSDFLAKFTQTDRLRKELMSD